MKKTVLNIICGLLFALLAGTAAWVGTQIWRLNMLAGKYLYPVIAALVLITLLVGFFLLPKRGKKGHKCFGRIVACMLAVILSVGFILGALAVNKIHETMDAVTTVPESGTVVEVYTMKENSVNTLEETGKFVFGWTDAFDSESAEKTISAMEQKLGSSLTLQQFSSVPQMVDALYEGKVDAVILSSSYVSVLEDIDTYASFSKDTKSIFSYLVTKTSDEQTPAPTDSPKPTEEPAKKPEKAEVIDPFVVYLSGSDTRSEILDTSRSDVNILVVVNPQTKQILLVNTPRDYYVPHPFSESGTRDKLTHCGVYGIDCSVDALSQLYDQKIDYYAQINFTGFETLIDAVGGVTVNSEVAFKALNGGYFKAGENHLNGAEALSFARERYAFATGDNQRGKNQMKVITAVIEKMTSGTTIINNYASILESLQGMFVTSVPRATIENLVKMQLSDMASWNVKSYAVSGRGDMRVTYSTPDHESSVMWPDEDAVAHGHDLIQMVLDGEILTDEALTVPSNS